MREKLHTNRVIVVEGKYDAARLAGLTDAVILQTDGFSIYRDSEKRALLRRLAQRSGLLVLTDSDAAGFRIRTFVTQLAGEENVLHAYIPAAPGKEARKPEPGKEGLLGVEGISDDILYPLLQKALEDAPEKGPAAPDACGKGKVTYAELYRWGLSGTAGAAERKSAFLRALQLPPRLSKKELVEVLNRLYTPDYLEAVLDKTARPADVDTGSAEK